MATLPIRRSNEKGIRSRKRHQQLLPGIPDDITLIEISPKLPWKVFYILSAVSRAWDHAIRSRKVYDARVLSHSTEGFVIVNLHRFRGWIGLLSTRDNSQIIKLPQIGHRSQRLVSFDGRIYLLGRAQQSYKLKEQLYISDEVFVLDVAAREGRWRKCASMREARRYFDAAVTDGKIYVCGGATMERGRIKFCGSEVYNPTKDLWSPIKPMAEGYHHQTEVVGEELFVHSGSIYGWDSSSTLNVYHPGKDEWRVVSPFRERRWDQLFVARGILHSIDYSGIDFYNAGENSWTNLHSFSPIEPAGAVWMDDELLIRYWVETGRHKNGSIKKQICLEKSDGFGSENREIVWQKVPLTNSRRKLLENTRERLTCIQL